MNGTIFLTLEQVLVIHEDQIERYGGSIGIRDLALLESAIFRPQSSFSGQDLYETIFDKATALVHSLLLNHAFIDGNKRTSTVSTIVFLKLNGWNLVVSQNELVQFAKDVEEKKLSLEQISFWLEKNSKN